MRTLWSRLQDLLGRLRGTEQQARERPRHAAPEDTEPHLMRYGFWTSG